ncbi:NAD-dependent epimerase/dehydratase family protein [Plantactinospora mayteni]|uniref:UDP-glucose 4-epimerase n=1 Tax=Plantactinospora mayteni TaxID=566021 RepID=A0ABQ4EWC0_9ACTN|nr:NAD-dependent epimerase/dehydratase family protein [Plantactinospora mayteni]GIG98975.1 UDP-glucose 4-epimerase [Plantactinospora mayteni]
MLVTGGAGFLGIAVVRRLRAAGQSVAVLDDGSAGTLRRLHAFADDAGVVHHLTSVCDADAVAELHRAVRPWAVVHLAARHFIPECERDPQETARVNVAGTASLLAAWRAHRPQRFVFASSAAVYADSTGPLSERSRCAPRTVYGHTKLEGERMVHRQAARRGVAALSVRLFNLYGPGPTADHLVPTALAQARAGGALHLGDLRTIRDYVYVEDAADAVVALLARDVTGRVNIGTGRGTAGQEVVASILEILGVTGTVARDPARTRARDSLAVVADVRRLRAILPAWRPVPLREGLLRTARTAAVEPRHPIVSRGYRAASGPAAAASSAAPAGGPAVVSPAVPQPSTGAD